MIPTLERSHYDQKRTNFVYYSQKTRTYMLGIGKKEKAVLLIERIFFVKQKITVKNTQVYPQKEHADV